MLTLPDPHPVRKQLQHLLVRGVAWVRGGLTPEGGMGCYGLERNAYALAGLEMPETAHEACALFVPVQPPYQAWDIAVCQLDEIHLALVLEPPRGFHIAACTNGLAQFSLRSAPWKRTFQRCMRYGDFICD